MTPVPEAVLWDMDGTLIDSEKIWDIGLRELAEQLGGELTQQTRDAVVGSNMDSTMRVIFTSLGLELEPAALEKAAMWLNERTAALFRISLPWRPGAREALESLREHDVPMALVTSTERALTEIALDSIGRSFFAATVCGDEVGGRNKPDPAPYLIAADMLGVPPGRCVAVEDSPLGMRSAVAAGCTVLVVPAEVPIEPGAGWTVRNSLVGVDAFTLGALRAADLG
ncbi:HAD family phosphatase [Kibdelosporangium persicum]|uniref:Phosphorylated carbohydrates phosphatase n=1 Tax=Kibdelosporangium persicum TaxID=2698649 RepID=A0ABX2F0P2_9PSEU|nr:HAD family phosphatase [Kibdelosporangium persicum]NRN64879.1 Phosphorylated carbohydrates phosphatase [Kibdelosporangium persicum]